jgi:hypothetical protein
MMKERLEKNLMLESKEFKKLLAASFVSQTGSHFLTLALSAFILISTGSPVQSASVFVLSFLPSILVGAKLGHWVDQKISKWLIARNELISVIATLLCAICIQYHLPMLFLCVVLALRSILMFVSRSAATKWLKLITPPAQQTNRFKVFYLGFFLSTAVSGLMAAVVLKYGSIWTIAVIDSGSYVLGTLFYLALRPVQNDIELQAQVLNTEPQPTLYQTLSHIFSLPAVKTSFLVVCFSQAIFQGAYSAFVSYLPIQAFRIGIEGIGAFQLAASIGITGGFLINWLASSVLTEKNPVKPTRAKIVSLIAVVCLIACVSCISLPLSLLSFFGLNLAYECVWLHHNSEFFRGSPKHYAARYQFTLSACAAFMMSAATLAYSVAVEYIGPTSGAIAVLILSILLVALSSLLTRLGVVFNSVRSEGQA